MLKIYNSQTRQKEEFIPIKAGEVSMYVCGPTVYGYLHVGNFRGVVFFNLVRNWLESFHNLKVTYALNFTDVDDKIINKAAETKQTPTELAEHYIAEYKKDFLSLGLKPHDHNPKVSESMDDIINMIQSLIDKGHAYEAKGDVWFSVESFAAYGKLSNRKTDENLEGTRVEHQDSKKSPLDFALWKSAKAGEISWDSKWGKGRPGWHIECSAMIKKLFGDQIDIHGGGLDLMFPHHENEIAQSEGANSKPFVKYWMHNNMLNFSGQKMSKSLGNIVSLREFMTGAAAGSDSSVSDASFSKVSDASVGAEIYKWMMLSVHYRSVTDFSEETSQRAIMQLARIYSALAMAQSNLQNYETQATNANAQALPVDRHFADFIKGEKQKIAAALDDDFNTPEMIAVLFEIVRTFNSKVKRMNKPSQGMISMGLQLLDLMQWISSLTGLFGQNPSRFLTLLDDKLLKEKNLERSAVVKIIGERIAARDQKNFAKSDELRDQLLAMGIVISDTPEGTYWEVNKGESK